MNSGDARAMWLDPNACRVADLESILETGRNWLRPPCAADMRVGIPVYDCRALRPRLADPALRAQLLTEWHHVLADGAGVLLLDGACSHADIVERVTTEFFAMIDDERAAGGSGGDHFAKAGANNRVWNALQKLALRNPAAFSAYYGNPFLALPALAWLGPGYQVTSQVNCVNPGGAAQTPHRDYHLGFCTPAQAAAYPLAVHHMSPRLTLQGAVAHVDMPVESGPTLLLPHSQKYPAGYLIAGREDFDRCFDAHHVQPPLRQGDAMFFNPAMLHAAGSNKSTSTRRIANLLQISSAFGRAMESVDRVAMSLAIYPALLEGVAAGTFDVEHVHNTIAACAEGYAFPTNLDRDPPVGGLAPESQQTLMGRALKERWAVARFADGIAGRAAQQRA